MLNRYKKLRCLFFRLRVSHALDHDKPLSERIQVHVLHCPACRRFHDAALALPERLVNAPLREGPHHESTLADRVMARVKGREAKYQKPGVLSWRPRVAFALAACLVLLVLGGLLVLDQEEKTFSSENDTNIAEEAVFKQGLRLINVHLGRIGKTTLGIHVVEPLKAEVERLSADAKSLQTFFLALLPTKSFL